MKKILPVFFNLAIIFNLVSCSNAISDNKHTSSEISTAYKDKSTDENNKDQQNSMKEVTPVKKMSTINITVDNTTFTATLKENNTAKALVKQLPLTVDMSEHNGNEKYNYLSSNLIADTASSSGKVNEGDLMLFGSNCLVLFYKTFNTSYSYVKLAHIDDTTGLAKAIGSSNVNVTFSVSE